jgi:hypothetical protein
MDNKNTKYLKNQESKINKNKEDISTKCSKNKFDEIRKELDSFVKLEKFNYIIDHFEPLIYEVRKNLERFNDDFKLYKNNLAKIDKNLLQKANK